MEMWRTFRLNIHFTLNMNDAPLAKWCCRHSKHTRTFVFIYIIHSSMATKISVIIFLPCRMNKYALYLHCFEIWRKKNYVCYFCICIIAAINDMIYHYFFFLCRCGIYYSLSFHSFSVECPLNGTRSEQSNADILTECRPKLPMGIPSWTFTEPMFPLYVLFYSGTAPHMRIVRGNATNAE